RAIDRAKRRFGSRTPEISFNMVLMRSNITELPALVRLAHELGGSGVAAVHLTPYDGLNLEGESLAGDAVLCNRMLDEAREVAKAYGIGVALPANFESPPTVGPTLQSAVFARAKTRN